MRSSLTLFLAATGAVILQAAILPLLPFGTVAPDILLVLAVYLGLHQKTVAGAIAAFLLGSVEDSLAGSMAGLNSFAMCLVFLFVYLTSRRLWVENVVSEVVVVFVASVVKISVAASLLAVFVPADGLWSASFRGLVFRSALAAFAAPFLFSALTHMRSRAAESR